MALTSNVVPSSRQWIRRRWDILIALTLAETREARDLTVLGFVKWILEPLSYVATYVILVQVMLRRGTQVYPLFVFCAVLPWQYFQAVVPGAMSLINNFSGVIGNRAFPRGVLPLSLALKEVTTFVLGLLLFIPLMAAYSVDFTMQLLWLPLIVATLVFLCVGPAYIAAVFGVYFPDFRGLVSNLLRIVFLASTALVRPGQIPGETLPRLIKANPLSGIFNSFRDVVIRGRAPRVFNMVYPLAVGAVLLAVGVALYTWRQRHFAKEL